MFLCNHYTILGREIQREVENILTSVIYLWYKGDDMEGVVGMFGFLKSKNKVEPPKEQVKSGNKLFFNSSFFILIWF